MKNMEETRSSNIELLRILLTLGVMILHYNNAEMGKGFVYAQGVNRVVMFVLESIFICAVDVFILTSGYFMCSSQKRTLLKPMGLLIQVQVFSTGIYLVSVALGVNPFSFGKLLSYLLPANYFVILYCTLYFLSPFLNMLLSQMDKACMQQFLGILLLLFSVYPTLVDALTELTRTEWMGLSSIGMYGSQSGYSIVNFTLMYMIGAYLRKFPPDMSNTKMVKKVPIYIYIYIYGHISDWNRMAQ